MAKKPLFASDSTQKLAISGAMLFVLAMSLVVAAAYSATWSGQVTQVAIDGPIERGPMFRIQIPNGWRGDSTRSYVGTTIKPLAVFRDADHNHHTVTVGVLPDDVRRTPLEAMGIAVGDWRMGRVIHGNRGAVGEQLLIDTRLANLHAFQSETEDGVFNVCVLVMTDDGRRYHALIHERLVDANAPAMHAGDLALVSSMAATLEDPLRRAATADDVIANDLAANEADAQRVVDALSTEHMTLIADTGYGPTPILQVIPTDRKLGLWLLRLRGELSLPTEGEGSLTAADAMAHHVRMLIDTDVPAIEHTTPRDGAHAWTVKLPAPSNIGGAMLLYRQLSYVVVKDAAFLVESVADVSQRQTAEAQRERVIARLSEAMLGHTSATHTLLKARQEGEIIAAIQRQHAVASPATGWNYELLAMGGQTAGAIATYVGDNRDNAALPRLVQSLTLFKPANVKVAIAAQLSENGEQYVETLEHQYNGVSRRQASASTVTVTLTQGRLKAVRQETGRTVELWQIRAPGGFMAPGSELVWTDESLDRLTEHPAIIWQTHHELGPSPVVVSVETGVGVTGDRTLMMRSLLSIDADVATIDRQGRTRDAMIFIHRTARRLPMMLELRRVEKIEFDRYLTSLGERLVVPGE